MILGWKRITQLHPQCRTDRSVCAIDGVTSPVSERCSVGVWPCYGGLWVCCPLSVGTRASRSWHSNWVSYCIWPAGICGECELKKTEQILNNILLIQFLYIFKSYISKWRLKPVIWALWVKIYCHKSAIKEHRNKHDHMTTPAYDRFFFFLK